MEETGVELQQLLDEVSEREKMRKTVRISEMRNISISMRM
jgi:hypothetical protein